MHIELDRAGTNVLAYLLSTKITVLIGIDHIITIIMSTATSSNKGTDSQQASGVSSTMQQVSTQWAEIIGQLFDRLTGKGASVTYTFDNLIIDMPRATGPTGQDIGSVKWTVNGKIVITAEAHKTAEEARQRALTASSS